MDTIFDKPLNKELNDKPDYATEMPMSDSDLTTVSQAIAGIKGDVSIGSSLTSNYCNVVACLAHYIGKLAVYFLEISTTTIIPARTEFISGLKIPRGTRNDIAIFDGLAVGSSTEYRISVRDGGKLMNLDEMPTGTRIRMTFMYFTD